jgi:hypothetical protein
MGLLRMMRVMREPKWCIVTGFRGWRGGTLVRFKGVGLRASVCHNLFLSSNCTDGCQLCTNWNEVVECTAYLSLQSPSACRDESAASNFIQSRTV